MKLPHFRELGLRAPGIRVYMALQRPGGATSEMIMQALLRDGRPRQESAVHVALGRLDKRLYPYGIAIARLVTGHAYRLVPR